MTRISRNIFKERYKVIGLLKLYGYQLLKKPAEQREQNTQHDADDNHGGDRKKAAKTRPLDTDVAGEAAKPIQPIAGEPDE
jgi:hypothetical protein